MSDLASDGNPPPADAGEEALTAWLVRRWKETPASDRLLLLGLWGIRPGWYPPKHVLAVYGASFTQTIAPAECTETRR